MTLRVVALHVALAVAIWLAGTLVYVAKFIGFAQPAWFAIDAVVAAGCFGVAMWRWNDLGIRVVSRVQLVALVLLSVICVEQIMALVHDLHWMAMDETQYLATLREGTLRTHAFMPFNMRWLMPILAGPLNVIPANDEAALASLNAGALVVTSVYLALLVRRLGVRLSLAFIAPIILFSSFLGEFAGMDRLVLDPFNYAFGVLIFHAFLRREHARLLAVLLVIAGFNSEKTLYWIPVLGLAERFRGASIKDAVVYMLKVGGPFLVYLAALMFLLRHSTAPDNHSYVQHLHQMSPTWLDVQITKWPVPQKKFQFYWFPFGGFTVYALLGLRVAEKWLCAVALMLLPIYFQVMVAYDTERMVAYAYIVYLPFGFLLLEHAFRSFPRWLPYVLTVLLVALAFSQRWLVYYEIIPAMAPPSRLVKLVISTTEILLVASIAYLHLVVFRDQPPPSAGSSTRSAGHHFAS